MAEQKEEDNGTETEDAPPIKTKATQSEKNSSATSDKPPKPPKRDYSLQSTDTEQDNNDEYASVKKRNKLGSFPTRPEFVYKPDSPESRMACIRNILVIINLLIWLLGAAITGLGIWIAVDSDFLDFQTNLDLKQFETAIYVMIIVGVLIMLVGFMGCYGAIASRMCMLIIFSILVILIMILEIAVMAIVWAATTNKNFKEDIKLKATIGMKSMMQNKEKQYFFNLLQNKLHCCGVNGKEDYSKVMTNPTKIPPSCFDKDTGQPYERGCYDSVVEYFTEKASVVGGVALAIFLLQLGLLVFAIVFMCGLRQATNSIF